MTGRHAYHPDRIAPQRIDQKARGQLTIFEESKMPFSVKRTYVIQDVSEAVIRGGHAHHTNDQVLFVLKGALTLHLDDGLKKETLRVSAGESGVRLAPLLWHSMSDFTSDAIALVCASHDYDADDYIHDYDEFKRYAGAV